MSASGGGQRVGGRRRVVGRADRRGRGAGGAGAGRGGAGRAGRAGAAQARHARDLLALGPGVLQPAPREDAARAQAAARGAPHIALAPRALAPVRHPLPLSTNFYRDPLCR